MSLCFPTHILQNEMLMVLHIVLCADKGKKFNAKKETALGEEYYGIKIFRFYIVSITPLFFSINRVSC